jgi:hypothetical protein
MKEVDVRPIYGNGGHVYLLVEDEFSVQHVNGYTVAVHDYSGTPVAVLKGLTEAEGWTTWLHPFAREDVPNIFARSVEWTPEVEVEPWDGKPNGTPVQYCASCGGVISGDPNRPHDCRVLTDGKWAP